MGRQYQVSYNVEGSDGAQWEDWPSGKRLRTKLPNGDFLYRLVPKDAVITDITPKPPAFESDFYGAFDGDGELEFVVDMESQRTLDWYKGYYRTLSFMRVDIKPKNPNTGYVDPSTTRASFEGYSVGDFVRYTGDYGNDKGIVKRIDHNKKPIQVEWKRIKGLFRYSPTDLEHITRSEWDRD